VRVGGALVKPVRVPLAVLARRCFIGRADGCMPAADFITLNFEAALARLQLFSSVARNVAGFDELVFQRIPLIEGGDDGAAV
jgi:hypothetical protein